MWELSNRIDRQIYVNEKTVQMQIQFRQLSCLLTNVPFLLSQYCPQIRTALVVAVGVVVGALVTTPILASNVLAGGGSANQEHVFTRLSTPVVTLPPLLPSFPSIVSLNNNKELDVGGKGGEREIFLPPLPIGEGRGRDQGEGTTDLSSLLDLLEDGGAEDGLPGGGLDGGIDGGGDGLGLDGGLDGIGLDGSSGGFLLDGGLDGFGGAGIDTWDSNDFSNALSSLLDEGGLDGEAGIGTGGGPLSNLTDIFFSLMNNDDLLAEYTFNVPAITDPPTDSGVIPSDTISDRLGFGGRRQPGRRRRSKCLTILRVIKALTGGNRRRNRNNRRRNNRRNERRREKQERREDRREERLENRNERREEKRENRNERLEDKQDRRQQRREDRLDRREETLDDERDELEEEIRRERRRRRRQRRNSLLARIFCFFVDAAKANLLRLG